MLRKKRQNNQMNRSPNPSLRMLTYLLIMIGIWISASNLYHYSRGYFADRFYTSAVRSKENDTQDLNLDVTSSTEKPIIITDITSDDVTIDLDQLYADKESIIYEDRPISNEQFGELYIPKLDSTLPIYEGTDEEELKQGVGHYSGSVLPGEKDNCILAGHRDTVFRRLGEVGEGDRLIVRSSMGEFEYIVYKVRIVDKEDRTVIVPKPKATLTVSTCYPFRYVGSAPDRFIWLHICLLLT